MRSNYLLFIGALAALTLQWWSNRRDLQRLERVEALAVALTGLEDRTRALEQRPTERPPAPPPAVLPVQLIPSPPVAVEEEDAAPERPPARSEPAVPPTQPLEHAFVEERPDPAWAEETADRIVAGCAAQLPASSSVGDVDCRRTLCRVEVRHQAAEGHAAILDLVMNGEFFWKGAGTYSLEQDESGNTVSVVYLAREGVDPWAQPTAN